MNISVSILILCILKLLFLKIGLLLVREALSVVGVLVINYIHLNGNAVFVFGALCRSYLFHTGGIHKREWIVECVRVTVPCLRVPDFGAGHERVWTHKTANGRRIVPCAKIVQSRLGIPFLAGEFVTVTAGRRNDALAAEGVEVGIIEDGAGRVGDDAGGTQMVRKIIVDVVLVIAVGDALASEENVLLERGIGDAAGGGWPGLKTSRQMGAPGLVFKPGSFFSLSSEAFEPFFRFPKVTL